MQSLSANARSLLAGLLLALCAATAMPQTPSLYTVEIIVFRHAGSDGALPGNTVPPAVTDDGIEATPATPALLNAAARKLDSSSDFKVLARAAWTQGPAAWPENTPWTACLGVTTTQLEISNSVDGKIYLLRGNKLNLAMDLTIEEGGLRYNLHETRPVKPNEINYFDHPAFGVLAIIAPATGD